MARSDLLLNLVKAATKGDQVLLKRSVDSLIAEERAKRHHVLADQLEKVQTNSAMSSSQLSAQKEARDLSIVPSERANGLYYEIRPARSLDNLILTNIVRETCVEIAEEHQRVDLLRSYNLEPRHRILLVGPPGNGKTSLAEALANALLVPLFVVRYEGVIGSYLGETAQKLLRLFDSVRGHRCVLFFDEFDTLGKERGDIHETGEIKRVVSSLLLQIDALPPHVVVVAATNHPELLDRAVWRRFQVRLRMPRPNRRLTEQWLEQSLSDFPLPSKLSPATIAQHLGPLSFSELEEFVGDVRRRWALNQPMARLDRIIVARLRQWQARRAAVKIVPARLDREK